MFSKISTNFPKFQSKFQKFHKIKKKKKILTFPLLQNVLSRYSYNKCLKIPKGVTRSRNRRKTDNTMAKEKAQKNNLQYERDLKKQKTLSPLFAMENSVLYHMLCFLKRIHEQS